MSHRIVLFFVHIVAFVAGGANSVVMPIIVAHGDGDAETRGSLIGIAEALAKVGKYAMITLIVTGLLVLWLKWNWSSRTSGSG